MVLNAQQIDLYVAFRDPLGFESRRKEAGAVGWMGVLYGLAPLDPLSLRNGSGISLFAPPFRLPSGVLAYPVDGTYLREYGELSAALFVLPNGTCVVTDQVSAPHARDLFAYNAAPPPSLQSAPDALGGASFAVTSMRFVSSKKGDGGSMMQGAVGAGVGLRGGRNGAIDAYADYASADDASRAYGAFQRTCEQKLDSCLFEPRMFKDARADLTGSRILVTLAFSDAILRSLQNYSP
jgi:hypothetical protein